MKQSLIICPSRWENHAFTIMGLALSVVMGILTAIVMAELVTLTVAAIVGLFSGTSMYAMTVLHVAIPEAVNQDERRHEK